MKDYKKILKGVVNIIKNTEKTDIGFANICSYLSDNCDELFENNDDKIRKHLISLVKNWDKDGIVPKYTSNPNDIKQILSWLEKQDKQ